MNMPRRNIHRFFYALSIAVGICTGCSTVPIRNPIQLSDVRPSHGEILETEEKILLRSAYREALGRIKESDQARLVEVFHNATPSEESAHEFRLFDIDDTSPYGIVGLRNGDIILGAHDYVVPSSRAFRRYLFAVASESSSSILIRRGSKTMLLKFRFVD